MKKICKTALLIAAAMFCANIAFGADAAETFAGEMKLALPVRLGIRPISISKNAAAMKTRTIRMA